MEQKQQVVTPEIERAALILSKRNLIGYKLRKVASLSEEIVKDIEELTILEGLVE